MNRDDQTIAAAMAFYDDRPLRTLADYQALPGVVGVEIDAGRERAVTLYVAETASSALDQFVKEHREVNVMVTWKRCRRVSGEGDRRAVMTGALPRVPTNARWE